MRQIRYILLSVFSFCCTVMYSQSDSLATYIAEAIRTNPSVIGQYKAYLAKAETACGEGQLNDLEVSVSVFPKGMEHVNTKQLVTVSVMQMFPWFGTLRASRTVAEREAEVLYQAFRENGIALAYNVQKQWFTILSTQEKLRILEKQKALLTEIQNASLALLKTASAGKGKMSEQLRLQSEQLALDEKIETLKEQFSLQKQQLNIMMHRDGASALVIPDTLIQSELPALEWEEIVRQSPALQRISAEKQTQEAMETKVSDMGKPTFGVGVEYMINGKVDQPMMESMNGKNMFMPMLKINLPLYRKKTNCAVRSAQLMQQSAQQNYQAAEDKLYEEKISLETRLAEQERLLNLYFRQQEILLQTVNLVNTEYANGSATLTDVLAVLREVLDVDFKRVEAVATYNIEVAEYEKLASMYDYAHK